MSVAGGQRRPKVCWLTLAKKRQLETGDVEEGDYETFSRQADFLDSEAKAFEALVRDLEAIELVMVERRRDEHPPGEMRD